MKKYLAGLFKRVAMCLTAPAWIPLAGILLVVVYFGTLVAGAFQWLFTGKKTILNEFDQSFI